MFCPDPAPWQNAGTGYEIKIPDFFSDSPLLKELIFLSLP
jgi:hypothetical protein